MADVVHHSVSPGQWGGGLAHHVLLPPDHPPGCTNKAEVEVNLGPVLIGAERPQDWCWSDPELQAHLEGPFRSGEMLASTQPKRKPSCSCFWLHISRGPRSVRQWVPTGKIWSQPWACQSTCFASAPDATNIPTS